MPEEFHFDKIDSENEFYSKKSERFWWYAKHSN